MKYLKCFIILFWAGFFFSGYKKDISENHFFSQDSSVFCGYDVSYNPYESVNWKIWKRCLSQTHDHINNSENRMRMYDDAGYNAIISMQYRGLPSDTNSIKIQSWPVYKFINSRSDEEFLSACNNLKFFIPGMEEVGNEHIISAFMTRDIAPRDSARYPLQQEWEYTTTQECIDLVNKYDGIPIIAHPKRKFIYYDSLSSFSHIEVYNAFYRYQFAVGENTQDDNEGFVRKWDRLLQKYGGKIWGVAVNDHYGPNELKIKKSNPDIYDSGKTLVMVKEMSLQSYRESFEKGSFFAIKDIGVEKGNYPVIDSVKTVKKDNNIIIIYTNPGNEVKWFYNLELIYKGAVIDLKNNVPKNINYIRAEVSGKNATVYVQPFSLSKIYCK